MNNDTNKINGIGLIRNNLNYDKAYQVYHNYNWNRYIYTGDYWIGREKLQEKDNNLLEQLEISLFKGKGNIKRISGISLLSETNYKKWGFDESRFKNLLKNIFIHEFKQ
jgi:hypothetical protein